MDPNPEEDDQDEVIILKTASSRGGTVSYKLSDKYNLEGEKLFKVASAGDMSMLPLSSVISNARVFLTPRRYEENGLCRRTQWIVAGDP